MTRLSSIAFALLLVLLLSSGGARAAVQTEPAAPTAQDGWNFSEDEEAVPTWSDHLKDQAVDLVLFSSFATLAMVGFFRKSERLKWITMGVAVLYLGVWKSQLLSVVDVFRLTNGALPPFRESLVWYLFAAFTLVTTVLWGRLYCGRICAFGSMTQLLDKAVPARFRYEVPAWIERRANYIKYVLLGAVLIYYVVTRDILIYRKVEPFWMFSREAATAEWIVLALLLAATVFVRNLYCRFLCPLGAFLGLLSNLTVFRIKRWSECNTCKICEKTCEWGAIRGPKIVASECVRCDDCERLYMDQAKCPHWLILKRKEKRAATAQ
jgi:polyferredoxin